MQRNDAEDEHQGQDQHDHGVHLQAGRFVRVQSCKQVSTFAFTASAPPRLVRFS